MEKTTTNMTETEIETIRRTIGIENADISRACSAALWGQTPQKRAGGRRKLARLLAAR